jgi:alpha-beta hydrolase superfamily lysophospholipase
MVAIAKVLSTVLPRLALSKLDSSTISRDPEVVNRYDNDPLNYRGGMPSRTGMEIMRAMERIGELMENLTLPVLIMHGSGDKLVDSEGSKQLYERAGSEDKTLKLYDGLYHEILNEPEKEQVLKDMVAWLDKRI